MDLSNRMKMYESIPKVKLIRRMPIIIRVDGKAFHTLTRKMVKPFDPTFENVMNSAALMTAGEIQNCVFAYIQSDEVSFLVIDYKTLQTEPWFGNDLQKIVSVSAAKMTAYFNLYFRELFKKDIVAECFDSRAFNLTKEEVCNYFIWRQQDATRNSIQSVAQAHFTHNELQGLNTDKLQDKLMLEKGINWNDIPVHLKRGRCILKRFEKPIGTVSIPTFEVDMEPPIFTQERGYIEKYLEPEET